MLRRHEVTGEVDVGKHEMGERIAGLSVDDVDWCVQIV